MPMHLWVPPVPSEAFLGGRGYRQPADLGDANAARVQLAEEAHRARRAFDQAMQLPPANHHGHSE